MIMLMTKVVHRDFVLSLVLSFGNWEKDEADDYAYDEGETQRHRPEPRPKLRRLGEGRCL